MPPKYARRRAAARKSVQPTTPAIQEPTLQNAATPVTGNEIAATEPTVDSSPPSENPTTSETAEVPPEPSNAAVADGGAEKVVGGDGGVEKEVGGTQSNVALSETLTQTDAVLSETKTVTQSDVVLSESLAQTEETGNEGKEVGGSGIDNGGKGKKTVKKVVKVVKKVVKKVPKKDSKGENDDKAENSNLGAVSNPNLVELSEGKTEELNEDGDVVQLNEDVISEGHENEKEKEVESGLTEVDKNESNKGVVDVVPEKEGKDGKKDDSGVVKGEGDEKGTEEHREADEGDVNAAGKDVEMGEGKLFRGELEAMERKKRRKTEIFIGGLDKDATEEDVRKVFEEVGEIVSLRVVMNAKTGKNKGFAFLRYASAVDAKRALEKFAKVEICGKQCGATPVEGNDTLFLGNIDKKWKENDVLKLLQESGIENIDKVTVMVNPKDSECNRGFAFVEFETSKDAQVAYKKFSTKNVFRRNQNVKVAWAEPLKELDEEEMSKVKTVYAEFLPSSWDEDKVKDIFKKFGEIDDVVLARTLRTTKRKDFAFVSYKTREAAIKCIESFDRELNVEDGTKVNVKVSLAKPMQKGKSPKQVAKPSAKEVPRKKQKTGLSSSRLSEPRNRAQPIMPHYTLQMPQRPSPNAELVHLLREQASWRPAHATHSPRDVHYSNLPYRKRQFSSLEANPSYPDSSRYPYSHLDASYPVASSSYNVVRNPIVHHLQQSAYSSGSVHHGARHYPSNFERRDRAHGSSHLYRRYD